MWTGVMDRQDDLTPQRRKVEPGIDAGMGMDDVRLPGREQPAGSQGATTRRRRGRPSGDEGGLDAGLLHLQNLRVPLALVSGELGEVVATNDNYVGAGSTQPD